MSIVENAAPKKVPVRVRIAPSPTGNLHVGTARTALFNYLFAKAQQGQFILRIEDTDSERSTADFERNIYDSLLSLGLSWDEGPSPEGGEDKGSYGPYKQSQRGEFYTRWANALKSAGFAYDCYLTSEELDAERAKAKLENRPYVYSGRCRDPKVREELAQDPARKASLRFRIPDNRGVLIFKDHVRDEVSFDTDLIGDFVIMKSDGTPTYNFAVVIDDWLMRISHIIRGEDHISNTPKQVLIYEALQALKLPEGTPPVVIPEFAHVGMILAPDRSKLSKRHGATAVSEFIQQGYLPEAFCNFLSLLGWAPPDGEEVGTLEHFASQFSLDRIAQSPAIFDKDKLHFLNSKLIRLMPLEELLERAKPYLSDFDLGQYPKEKLLMILDAVREPITVLSELPESMIYFFGQKVILDARLVGEVLSGPEPEQVLKAFQNDFLSSADFTSPEALAEQLKAFTKSLSPIKTKTIMWTVRAALTGRTSGADLSKTLYILGRDIIQSRVETALILGSSVTN
ncbi:MAG: glutamate--tRNA ligase [Vampirovibrionales bacterium]|nr:glutamate--tRNA ligase [Vampirovibrionales bacterium]